MLALMMFYLLFLTTSTSVSVLPAITLDGLIWASTVLGSFNGSTFLQFLDGVLGQMNAYPAPKSVLIMDNCAIHHIDEVEIRCRQRCAEPKP